MCTQSVLANIIIIITCLDVILDGIFFMGEEMRSIHLLRAKRVLSP